MSKPSDPPTPPPQNLESLPEGLRPVGASEEREHWLEYSPQHAPHVAGVFSRRRRDPESGQLLSQTWKALCLKCGAAHKGWCSSGAIKSHIARFGGVHAGCAGDVFRPRGKRD